MYLQLEEGQYDEKVFRPPAYSLREISGFVYG